MPRPPQTESPGCDLLCLGDSLIKHGLVPGVIEKRTGLRTVNLSAARAPALLTYFLLRRALDAGATAARPSSSMPSRPCSWPAPSFNARYWQEVLTPRECLEFSLMTRNGPFMLATIVGRLLPSLRSRLEVRSNVLAALRGETDRIPAINRVLVAQLDGQRRGQRRGRQFPQPQDEVAARHRATPAPRALPSSTRPMPWEWSGSCSWPRAHDIPVFWLLTPLSPALQALRDQSGAEAGYERFVRSFVERYPRLLTVLDARRGGYPAASSSTRPT